MKTPLFGDKQILDWMEGRPSFRLSKWSGTETWFADFDYGLETSAPNPPTLRMTAPTLRELVEFAMRRDPETKRMAMSTPLTDDEAIAVITQLANRPWDKGSVKQCAVKGTLHALLGVLSAPGDALAASLNAAMMSWINSGAVETLSMMILSPHADGPTTETAKDSDPE